VRNCNCFSGYTSFYANGDYQFIDGKLTAFGWKMAFLMASKVSAFSQSGHFKNSLGLRFENLSMLDLIQFLKITFMYYQPHKA